MKTTELIKLSKFFILPFFILSFFQLNSQTNISAGNVNGTWTKAGSPYKILGQITVPAGQKLTITEGVTIEFQGAYMMHVYGSLQALGKAADTVTFTVLNKTTGWQGIHLHKNKVGADSNLFRWSKFEYANYYNPGAYKGHGALFLDTITNCKINNSRFQFNKSNTGGGMVSMVSTPFILNCIFNNNMADAPANDFVLGSAISIFNSTPIIDGCLFIKNKASVTSSSSDSAKAYGVGTLWCGLSNLTLSNCTFSKNNASGCSGIYVYPNSTSKISCSNVNFYTNYSSSHAVLYIENANGGNVTFNNLKFKNNKIGSSLFNNYQVIGTLVEATSKSFTIQNASFEKANGLMAIYATNGIIINSSIIGNDSLGLLTYKGNVQLINCIIANNRIGVDIDESQVSLINCTLVFNGDKNKINNIPLGGIHMASASSTVPTYKIFNSIIQNNRNIKGMANLLGGFGGTKIDVIRSSIIEGGIDSAKYFTGTDYQINKISATTVSNLIKDTVSFIKPPKGFGPAFYDSTNNFHIKNTCTYVYPGLNAGINVILETTPTVNLANYTDLDGNPRIKCGTVDIGPYELEGSKQSVSIDKEPTDQVVCPKTTVSIAPGTCGAALSYRWQKSNNNSTFTDINGASADNYSFLPKDSGWYRLIITQTECNKKDTSKAAKVSFKPGTLVSFTSQPRDTGICAGSSVQLQATNSGSVNTWRWQKSIDGNSFSNLSGATTNPYTQTITDTAWYRLIVKNTQCNTEDTSNKAKINKYPLPMPNLGSDNTISNTGTKTLDPGVFTSYKWNIPTGNGATTQTLQVNKTNLIVGANSVNVKVTDSRGCSASDTVIITLLGPSGIADLTKIGWKIYPIPVLNTLNIESPDGKPYSYSLSDIQGRILFEGQNTGTLNLPLENIASGTYFLNLVMDGNKYGVKVVK